MVYSCVSYANLVFSTRLDYEDEIRDVIALLMKLIKYSSVPARRHRKVK